MMDPGPKNDEDDLEPVSDEDWDGAAAEFDVRERASEAETGSGIPVIALPPADDARPPSREVRLAVPTVGLPDVGLPDVGLPDVGLPDVGLPFIVPDDDLPPPLPPDDELSGPIAAPEDFAEPTRQIEEFGGDTRPIGTAQLFEKLTESWVDSPADDLEITVTPSDEEIIIARHALTHGVSLDADPPPAAAAPAPGAPTGRSQSAARVLQQGGSPAGSDPAAGDRDAVAARLPARSEQATAQVLPAVDFDPAIVAQAAHDREAADFDDRQTAPASSRYSAAVADRAATAQHLATSPLGAVATAEHLADSQPAISVRVTAEHIPAADLPVTATSSSCEAVPDDLAAALDAAAAGVAVAAATAIVSTTAGATAPVEEQDEIGSTPAPQSGAPETARAERPPDDPRSPQATPAMPSQRVPHKFRAARNSTPHVGVAIDFGTTRSSVAVVVDGHVRILPLPNGRHDILSCVGIREDGSAVLGDRARELQSFDPRVVLPSPKRLLGRRYRDREIESHLAHLAVPTFEGPDGATTLEVRGRRYTVPQLCAPILYHLRLVAQQHLGQEVTSIVLTAPTAFDPPRHRALAETAALAGMRVQKFVDEPAAAALANRQDRSFKGLVGVYDFGGGTFDFSVIDVSSLTLVTTAGDSWLGGDDFDEVIASAAANAFWRDSGVEIRHQVVQWQRLLVAAEAAKRELSTSAEASLVLEQAALSGRGPLDLGFRINRRQFAELSRPLVERSMDTCQTALDLSGLAVTELNAIYLSGGTSYIPAVQDAVARFFGKIPLIAIPPEQAVVLGAACYAALPPTTVREP